MIFDLPDTGTPFKVQFSFHDPMERLEKKAQDTQHPEAAAAAEDLLRRLSEAPALRTGITEEDQLRRHEGLIRELLHDLFPEALTHNEIKAIGIPYSNMFFNPTERFRKILQAAGPSFATYIRDFDEHQFYVMSCCIILNEYYGTQLDFGHPLFYDIPSADGVLRHYRILHNADFLEIVPTENSLSISPEDIDLLLNNYNDLALWKAKFPPESWLLRGFSIVNLFDATVENAVSTFKENLLGLYHAGLQDSTATIFRSIYRIPDLQIGFTLYTAEDGLLSPCAFGMQMKSFLLPEGQDEDAREVLGETVFRALAEQNVYVTASDITVFQATQTEGLIAERLLYRNINSFILAPVAKNGQLLGILEIVSPKPRRLNSINANKLDIVLPYLTDTVERLVAQFQNQVQAVIQEKYTAIHGSVHWKFQEEAEQYIDSQLSGKEYKLQEIVFPEVYPLYGQLDIRGSSEARNSSIQRDLQQQLQTLVLLLDAIGRRPGKAPELVTEGQTVRTLLADLDRPLLADTEQYIQHYLEENIHPWLRQLSGPEVLPFIQQYFRDTDKVQGSFHAWRRRYENTVAMINDTVAGILDSRQKEAQALFPHYYERFKTDGVEHNLYIGPSIAPKQVFDIRKLQALRLWQLQVLCEMEAAYHQVKPLLRTPLEVTTLVLVHHSTLSIRFRLDEKRFDVDGSYNARFEIVKKRIDKAHRKGTHERITQPGFLTIVCSNDEEEQEYRHFIAQLQAKRLLDVSVERFDVEDLQGISGLRALRVGIVH
ncbi:hypothetical protein [Dawidia soli]|uniref:GAF domain-containing protein n=1 Tax=Dawidia soli TaxID=2782352 RepID=A0AAP2DGC5_9BACT|nr:hypothetical protein [Dawidia soli]MBT1690315.1 hypothetical protein [Dawidia soli]